MFIQILDRSHTSLDVYEERTERGETTCPKLSYETARLALIGARNTMCLLLLALPLRILGRNLTHMAVMSKTSNWYQLSGSCTA